MGTAVLLFHLLHLFTIVKHCFLPFGKLFLLYCRGRMRGPADRLPWDLDWGDRASALLQRHREPLCIYPQIPNKQQWGCSGHGNSRRVTLFSWQGIQLMYNHNEFVTYGNLSLNSQPTTWQVVIVYHCGNVITVPLNDISWHFLFPVSRPIKKMALGWEIVEKDLQQTRVFLHHLKQ